MTFEEWRNYNGIVYLNQREIEVAKETWEASRKEAFRRAAEICRERVEGYKYATDPWAEEHRQEAEHCAQAIGREGTMNELAKRLRETAACLHALGRYTEEQDCLEAAALDGVSETTYSCSPHGKYTVTANHSRPDGVRVPEFTFNELLEFLEGQEDVVDGAYGEQKPNRAMQLATDLRNLLEKAGN